MSRRFIILLVSFFFVFSAIFCQENEDNTELDKLEDQLLQSTLEEKFDILFQLSDKYRSIDTEKAKEYSLRAIYLANDINDSVNLLRFYQKLGDIYYELSRYKKSIDYYRKAI